MDKLTYGWLSPDGEFVKCNFYDHLDKAREIYPTVIKALGKTASTKDLYMADDGLLDLGWTKITRSEFTREWYIICIKFTKAQYDILKPLIENERIEPLSKYRFEDYEDRNYGE